MLFRSITICGHGTQSSTKVVRGTIDQTQPTVVALSTSTKGNTFVDTDIVTVTYSEHILCSGKNQNSNAIDYDAANAEIVPVITMKVRDITVRGGGHAKDLVDGEAVADDGSGLQYECEGAMVHISLGPQGKIDYKAMKAATGFYDRGITVTISGVVDVAGNEAVWDAAPPLLTAEIGRAHV